MSIRKKLAKVIQNLYRQLLKISRTLSKGFMTWLLRNLMVLRRRSGLAKAGFILPTVTMVILVVILLTTAIVFRSFDRAKNARNYRVSQEVMAAATPTIDRATAKLDALFNDPRLPRATPSDSALYNLLSSDNKFDFADEQRLTVAYDVDGDGNISNKTQDEAKPLEERDRVTTAWRFPVDTNGDGKFDSFTIYGIFFRSPARDQDGSFQVARSPLDARTPPMDEGTGRGVCAGALETSAKLVSQAGWYKSGSSLKKSFFVYTATVPIVENLNNLGIENFPANSPYRNTNNYQPFPAGSAPGFSALEYQQDRARIPLSNNAVVFQNDLALVSGDPLRLNGRIITNGNLFTTTTQGGEVELFQVSAPASCFYEEENSKITVGGHVINAGPTSDNYSNSRDVKVDLFVDNNNPQRKDLTRSNQSARSTEIPRTVLYNDNAYRDRVEYLVSTWIADNQAPANQGYNANDPNDVKTQVKEAAANERKEVREKALTAYFSDRTRRVPFEEVARGVDETLTFTAADKAQGQGDQLRPPDKWMFPYGADGKSIPAGYAPIELNINGNKVRPAATVPDILEEGDRENEVGDRILVGHNLPAVWYKDGNAVAENERQDIAGTTWDLPNGTNETRTRATQVTPLSDVGDNSRDGFWEKEAARQPENLLDPVGGLRIVTGAGVYERKNSFLPPPTWDDPTTETIEAKINDETVGAIKVKTTYYDDPSTTVVEKFPIVWPDTMPMSPMAGEIVYSNADSGTLAPNPVWKETGWKDNDGQGLPTAPQNSPFPDLSANDFRPVGGGNNTTIDPNTRKYAKGDLRMRATAVYHYAQDRYQRPSEGTDREQKPIACVSSYYDPTNATTARNRQGLPDVSGQLDWPSDQPVVQGKSNNGVSYPPPSTTSVGIGQMNTLQGLVRGQGAEDYGNSIEKQLAYQANLVFPNGRFVNEPLRQALLVAHADRTLAQQAAIDSTICSLHILGGATPNDSVIPHGAISEVAFLDSRQIQAIDKDKSDTLTVESVADLTGEYDLPIEERQPLEVRVTKIDLDKLRNQRISGSFIPGSGTAEYLLPNSGIIYASRDDALADLSQLLPDSQNPGYRLPGEGLSEADKTRAGRQSPVDYKLDPTRRPSGILLFNGKNLARGNVERFREEEKGLTLVTDLPAYIWAWSDTNANEIVDPSDESLFNPHSQEEFRTALNTATWANFYTRGRAGDANALNPNFACRPGDARLPSCTTGDTWRPATVIADSMTLLSRDFRFGFRDEGDYDLRNNNVINQSFITNRLNNGFFANNFVTNGFSSEGITINGTTPRESDYSQRGNNYIGSSYFNNFVTPVQRRFNDAGEYVMELCRKLPVSACTAEDWVVGYDSDGNDRLDNAAEKNVTIDRLGIVSGIRNTPADWTALSPTRRERLGAGTTALPALMESDRRFPRRIAFARTANHTLILNDAVNNTVRPIGVGCPLDHTGNVPENNGCVYGGTGSAANVNVPNRSTQNTLWFRTTLSTTDPGAQAQIAYQADRPIYYETNATRYARVLDATGGVKEKYVKNGTANDFKLFVPKALEDKEYGEIIAAELARLNLDNQPNNPITKYPFCLEAGCLDTNVINNPTDTALGAGEVLSPQARIRINLVRQALMPSALVPATAGDAIVIPTRSLAATGGTLEAKLSENPASKNPQKSVNVYDLPVNTFDYGATITLKGTPESIFVLRNTTGGLTFGGGSPGDGVKLNLEGGVDPNNIYWVVNGGELRFLDTSGAPHRLAGNFIGERANAITFNKVEIIGGRFLGFSGITPGATNVKIYGMTAQDQPITVPVLQLQIPRAIGGTIQPSGNFNPDVEQTNWHQKATDSTFNLISAVGNTPAREGEPDGGIGNFARILEAWSWSGQKRILSISGSLMQFDRSSYATGPYQPFLDTGFFNQPQTPGQQRGLFDYTQRYSTSTSGGQIPHSVPQDRRYGYDVGLLSQLPDLFSSQFTTPPTGEPDEFYREVSRDDPWLQALLCAKVPGNPEPYAVSENVRPRCPW
ncbi:hormogonium polysaccharide biosynthesis protein HpsA [Coleofasciculus sp. G2-EDA-02]|uniref:hormogonium polysaccharide biosynthesis protein HpsA n=1 Tax=Coleofasciculus sp. G2-EDA-02 TaxID=3069529 RepID=UPI0032F1F62E